MTQEWDLCVSRGGHIDVGGKFSNSTVHAPGCRVLAGTMGFGLPAGGQPLDALVIDIDGDGSFQMNVQELATVSAKNCR